MATTDPTTVIGKVRILIADASSPFVFTDADINGILTLMDQDILSTSGMLLRSKAADKALIAKFVKAGEFSEDTRDVSKRLIELAAKYEEMAQQVPAEADAEYGGTPFAQARFLVNEALRNAL